MGDELKLENCPFCGSPNVGLTFNELGSRIVLCNNCYAAGPVADCMEPESQAVELWSNRDKPV